MNCSLTRATMVFSCIFGQIQDGKHVVIYYDSKMFNKNQINYPTTEKEAYAIIYAVNRYRHLIYGKHITIYTDHNPLQYLNKVKHPNSRLMRWSIVMSEYDYTIKYKPGKCHQNADALSRFPIKPADDHDVDLDVIMINEAKPELRNDDQAYRTYIDSKKFNERLNKAQGPSSQPIKDGA